MRYDIRRGLTRRDTLAFGGATLAAAMLPNIAWAAGRTVMAPVEPGPEKELSH